MSHASGLVGRASEGIYEGVSPLRDRALAGESEEELSHGVPPRVAGGLPQREPRRRIVARD
jgi:hypothetical protein